MLGVPYFLIYFVQQLQLSNIVFQVSVLLGDGHCLLNLEDRHQSISVERVQPLSQKGKGLNSVTAIPCSVTGELILMLMLDFDE